VVELVVLHSMIWYLFSSPPTSHSTQRQMWCTHRLNHSVTPNALYTIGIIMLITVSIFINFHCTASILDLKVGQTYISQTGWQPPTKQHGVVNQKFTISVFTDAKKKMYKTIIN
jgi:hypothetical protein